MTTTTAVSIPSFTGDLIEPDHPDFDALRQVWHGAIDRRPSLIARPRTTDDVAGAALRFALEGDMAVRGACRRPLAGRASPQSTKASS